MPDRDTSGNRRYLVATATAHHDPAAGLADRPELADAHKLVVGAFTRLGYATVAGFGVDLDAERWRHRVRAFLVDGDRRPDDTIVVYHTGHGVISGENLLLPMTDTVDPVVDAIWPEDLTGRLLRGTQVRRLLVILDTCHSAQGGAAIAYHAHMFLNRLRGLDTNPAVAVIVSSRPTEEANPIAFTSALAAAISHESTGGVDSPYLALDGLVDVINSTTPEHQHARLFLATDGVSDFLPNPRYQPELADLDLWAQRRQTQREDRRRERTDHILPRGQGLDAPGDPDLWLFEGRHHALRAARAWLDRPTAATLVVTGDPGSGKSAFLSRLYILAHPDLHGRVPNIHDLPADTVPDLGAFTEFIHARAKTVDGLLTAIAHACGADQATTVTDLVTRLRSRQQPVVLIIDAVDESLDERQGDRRTFPAVERVLAPLVRAAAANEVPLRLLVGTRRPLIGIIGGPADIIDLDEPAHADPASVHRYVINCLTRLVDDSPYRAQRHDYLDAVATGISEAAGRSFLVALITARSLALKPELVDPDTTGWRAGLPTIPAAAMRDDLDSRLGPDATKARDLLLPLADAEGDGLPWEDLWPAVASALAHKRYTSDDIDWLIANAGFYITATTTPTDRRTVYRLFHEALAGHLRAGRTQRDDQHTIAELLINRVPRLDNGRPDWTRAHPYILNHLATHAARGNALDPLLLDPTFLLHAATSSLHAALPAAGTEPARAAAQAYRHAVHHLRRSLPTPDRAAYILLAAAQARADDLAVRCRTMDLPWTTEFAAWSPRRPHQTLTGHTSAVLSVVVGRVDGRDVIVSASDDTTVRVWDPATGAPIGSPLIGHTGAVLSVLVGRVEDRDVIVSAGVDRTVRMWDLGTGTPIGAPLTGHTGWVRSTAVGRVEGRDIIVSASDDKTVRVWNAATGTPVSAPLTGHADAVLSVALGQIEGRDVIVSASADKTVRVWDAATGTPVGEPLTGHTDAVWSVAMGRVDGRDLLASASFDATVRIWDAATGTPVGGPLIGHTGWVLSVAVGRVDGREVVVSAGADETVRVWDAGGGVPVGAPLTGHTHGVWSAASGQVSGRDIIATASADETVRIWDAGGGVPVGAPLTGHASGVWSVAAGQIRGCDVIVSAGDDMGVWVWDATTGRSVGGPLTGHTRGVCSVAMGQVDGRAVIVSGGDDEKVRVWDAATSTPIGRPFNGHTRAVWSVAVGRVGRRDVIVSGGGDTTVRMWDAATGTLVGRPLIGNELGVWSVAVGRVDGRDVIVSGGDDTTVRMWDGATGTPIGDPLAGHADAVWSVAVGRVDGRDVVVSASFDATIRVWDAASSTLIGDPLIGHTDAVRSVALGRVNGRDVIISASDDKTVRVWGSGSARAWTCRRDIDVGAEVHSIALGRSGRIVAGTTLGLVSIRLLAP